MNDATYKLDDLARAGGTSARTVRYYVQRGLIPAPAFKGKDTAYGHEHLVRLRAIRRLQEAFFPLDAIAVELERRSLAEIERLADGADLPTQAKDVSGASDGTAVVEIRQTVSARASGLGGERLFRRIELAPGVELSVADDLPVESKQMVETILRAVSKGPAT